MYGRRGDMSPEDSKRVIMTRKIAEQWLTKVSSLEYRLDILWGPKGIKTLPVMLRSLRDKTGSATLPQIPDLGIREVPDKISIWSSDRESLIRLNTWLERRNYETTGVW